MINDSLIGKVRFIIHGGKVDRSGRIVGGSPAARYECVIATVGGSHHMLLEHGQSYTKVIPNDELTGCQWWPDFSTAQGAFKDYVINLRKNCYD